MTTVLGLGDNTVDTYVDAGVQYPGGNAVNVAVMMARLGAKAAYLGCVGADAGGSLVREALEAEGIDISRLRVREGQNARAYIGHVAGDRQFICSDPGVRADYRWTQDDYDYIAGFDHVHTSIYSELGEALVPISRQARSLSLDVSNRWSLEYLEKTAPHTRFLFLSAAEMRDNDAIELANRCMEMGPQAVVLTRGGDGAIALDASGLARQAALPTVVEDTLGAGDGFISGFLTWILGGSSLSEAMHGGAEFAAQVCRWKGGFGHASPWSGQAPTPRNVPLAPPGI